MLCLSLRCGYFIRFVVFFLMSQITLNVLFLLIEFSILDADWNTSAFVTFAIQYRGLLVFIARAHRKSSHFYISEPIFSFLAAKRKSIFFFLIFFSSQTVQMLRNSSQENVNRGCGDHRYLCGLFSQSLNYRTLDTIEPHVFQIIES